MLQEGRDWPKRNETPVEKLKYIHYKNLAVQFLNCTL